MLATDLSAPSTITLRRIHDPRVRQYWDPNRVLSHAMGEHDRRSVVWDCIAVYKPEQIWIDAPPQPEFTGRPVVRFIDGTRKALRAIISGLCFPRPTGIRLSLFEKADSQPKRMGRSTPSARANSQRAGAGVPTGRIFLASRAAIRGSSSNHLV